MTDDLNLTAKAQDTLNAAVAILNNKLTFNFKSAGLCKEAAITDFPPETIAVLLDYGTRKLNDRVNSLYATPNNEKTREALVEQVYNEALAGKLAERKAPGSSEQNQFRDFILLYLRSQNVPATTLKPLKGATPAAIVNTIWHNADDARREAIKVELFNRWKKSLDMLNMDIDI